jgi:hypothetical protein
MYATMRAYYDRGDYTTSLRPILRWETTDDGRHIIAPDPFKDGMLDVIASALPDIDCTRLDGIMGIVSLAAYSPGQTKWDERSPYGKVLSDDTPTQEIEATQMGAFAVRKVIDRQKDPTSVPDNQDIQQSPVLDAWVRHLD